MTFEEIKSSIIQKFSADVILSENEMASPKCLEIDIEKLVEVLSFLHASEGLYFDSLSCLTGLDNGPEAETMEVIYNLYSIPYDHHLMLKLVLPREQPVVPSVVNIWKAADWQEREAYDMYGIVFYGHPDLRRILLPADWEGFPLRKDYKEQKYYHGVTVKY